MSTWIVLGILVVLWHINGVMIMVRAENISYVWNNPSLRNQSSKEIVFTVKNRCFLYPRCLLFNCCSQEMKLTVTNYFKEVASHILKVGNPVAHPGNISIGIGKHQRLVHSTCHEDTTSFYERLSRIPLRQVGAINISLVQDGIANLPPTHPHAFKIRETCCNFRVLYLVAGDNYESLSPAYSAMKDMIFLNYRKDEGRNNTLYFPHSPFLTSRMALYLAARQLEISQGWLYDYFLFADDDIGVDVGGYLKFETFLRQWRPAVAGPSLKKYPDRLFQALNHMDLMVWAYHREAVEILLPLIQDFDENCLWSSNLIANMEASYLYRNHMISTSTMHIWGGQHGSYKRDAKTAFPLVLSDFKSVVPPKLSHCVPNSVDIHTSSYYQGMKAGIIRPKMGSYHMMDIDINSIYDTEASVCPELVYNGDTIATYYNCCTIDNALTIREFSTTSKLSSYNNKIVTANNEDYFYIYGNIKHVVPANANTYMETGPVVFLQNQSILDSLDNSALTALNLKCNREPARDIWDDFAIKVKSGQLENKCIQVIDQRNVYIIRNSTLHYINFQQFVGLGFDFADVVKILWPTFEQLQIGPPLEDGGKVRIRRRK